MTDSETKATTALENNDPVSAANHGVSSSAAPQLTDDEIMQQEEWKKQCIELEKEIATLKTVITFKCDKLAELKRKLGVGVFDDFNSNVRHGLQNIKESEAYQKTGMAFKNFGSFASRKLGEVRGTNTFKSIEEKMGDAYTSVKSKVTGSKSGENEFGTCSENVAEAKEVDLPDKPQF